jgi:hypothetical protein
MLPRASRVENLSFLQRHGLRIWGMAPLGCPTPGSEPDTVHASSSTCSIRFCLHAGPNGAVEGAAEGLMQAVVRPVKGAHIALVATRDNLKVVGQGVGHYSVVCRSQSSKLVQACSKKKRAVDEELPANVGE